ncbi:MAG: hypothetical protein IJU58_03275 [Clostridia bacterium]|nr:hypothetical protein [Clostridia bacterium]
MLSIIILANKIIDDANTRQKSMLDLLAKYNIKYNVTYISTPKYNALQDIKAIVAQHEKYNLIILGEDTNKNSQIYVGLDSAKGDNALILDIDTNIDLIEQMLVKYKDGCENVFVRKRKNALHSFFVRLGMITYGFGLKLLKKLPDLCCESSVILLGQYAIDAILNNPKHQPELLHTNVNPEQKFSLIETKVVHDLPNVGQQKSQTSLFYLGILSIIFLLVTLAAMLIYPMFNGWIYSLWMFITIVLWLALSVAFCAVISKQIFHARQGELIPLDIDENPFIHLNSSFTHSDLYQQQEFMQYFATEQNKDDNDKSVKKEKKTKRSSKAKDDNNKNNKEKPKSAAKNKKEAKTKTETKAKNNKQTKTTTPTAKKRGRPPKQKQDN